ncbi:MAG: DUF1585 domain-containing protein [Gammaproteobacteria bacterium]|nr:DUF1585 domain-containing protein [Gammaproteobacteria bacterium]
MNRFNRVTTRITLGALLTCGLIAVTATNAYAGPREQAKRMHDRIAGVPPSAAVLDAMETSIAGGDALDAAELAMENSAFYTVTLKNFATPWTNEDQTVFASLNDYTATVIGMIRDNVPFNTALSADLLYVGASGLGLPAYSMTNNNHYEAMESQGIDLKEELTATTQSAQTNLPASATAGIMTTRAAAQAFFSAGTNRAMFRFTLMNHLCTDLEPIKDTTRSPDRIRQDVSRSPGGDSRIFLNACVGCHAGMDPMAQAFAYYDYNDASSSIEYNGTDTIDPETGTRVQGKYLINSDNFKYGYVTTDDHWDNYWRSGPNAALGWSGSLPGSGSGAKSLGMELANSDAFARCQAKKVFKTMCLRTPVDAADRSQIDSLTTSFKANNYSMKRIFAEAAVYCMGD